MKPQKKKKSQKKKKYPKNKILTPHDQFMKEFNQDIAREKQERQDTVRHLVKPYLHDENAAICERYLLELEMYLTCAMSCQDALKKEDLTPAQKSLLEADLEYWHEQAQEILEDTNCLYEEGGKSEPIFIDCLEKMSAWTVKMGWGPHPLFAEKFVWTEPILKYCLMRELRHMRKAATDAQ